MFRVFPRKQKKTMAQKYENYIFQLKLKKKQKTLSKFAGRMRIIDDQAAISTHGNQK